MAVLQTSFSLDALIDRVLGDVGLRGSNLITDGDVKAWAEEIVRKAAEYTHFYRKTTTMDVTSGTATYDFPTDLIALEYVAHRSLPLEQISLADLDREDPYWRQAGSGTPYVYYLSGGTSFTLFPTPSATVAGGLSLIYAAIPAMPASAADTFDFPMASEDLITSYCLYRAAMKDAAGEGGARVANYRQEYKEALKEMKSSVRGMAEGHSLVMGQRGTGWRRHPLDISHQIVPAP